MMRQIRLPAADVNRRTRPYGVWTPVAAEGGDQTFEEADEGGVVVLRKSRRDLAA